MAEIPIDRSRAKVIPPPKEATVNAEFSGKRVALALNHAAIASFIASVQATAKATAYGSLILITIEEKPNGHIVIDYGYIGDMAS